MNHHNLLEEHLVSDLPVWQLDSVREDSLNLLGCQDGILSRMGIMETMEGYFMHEEI
jgi:hypothetical protein